MKYKDIQHSYYDYGLSEWNCDDYGLADLRIEFCDICPHSLAKIPLTDSTLVFEILPGASAATLDETSYSYEVLSYFFHSLRPSTCPYTFELLRDCSTGPTALTTK